jgi:hypothetical protein
MLVAIQELQDYMDIKFSNRQKNAAGFVLAGLQSDMEAYLNRPVEITEFTDEVHILDSRYEGVRASSFMFYDTSIDTTGAPVSLVVPPISVYLRNSPVLSVSELKITPSSPSATPEVQTEGTDYVVRRWGLDLYRAWANDKLEVTYVAGIDGPETPMLRLLILRAASREMQNMHDDVVGIKDLETRNVAPLTTGFTPEEYASMKQYRRVQI